MLSDFVDKFLDEGWHDVVVTDVTTFTSKNGTDGVEFTCQAAGGATAPAGLFLTQKALPRFVRFASACGMSKAELRKFDETNPEHHRQLVGRRLRVKVGINERGYCQVDNFEAIQSAGPSITAPEGATPKLPDDDIPF